MQRKSKTQHKAKNNQRGGAIYTFDYNDKIGGLPARIPLNGTADGDCPSIDTKDLGFANYGIKKGGSRRRRTHNKSSQHKTTNNCNKHSHKHSHKHSRKQSHKHTRKQSRKH